MRRSSCANEAAHARTSFGTLDALPILLVVAGKAALASQAMRMRFANRQPSVLQGRSRFDISPRGLGISSTVTR